MSSCATRPARFVSTAQTLHLSHAQAHQRCCLGLCQSLLTQPSYISSPLRIGPHTVTLEVIEAGGLHQIAQGTLTLEVAPAPCAPDGVSAPCADELSVPGGSFLAGTEAAAGDDNEHPAHTAIVAPFRMDRYEVTVGRFRRFLASYDPAMPADGAGAHPLIPNSGWQAGWAMALPSSRDDFSFAVAECGGTWTDLPGNAEALPMTCVTWFEAFAFCAVDGKRLPTEAEWEYAAAGGGEQRLYPWGSALPSTEYAVYGCLFDGKPGCSTADFPAWAAAPAEPAAGATWTWQAASGNGCWTSISRTTAPRVTTAPPSATT